MAIEERYANLPFDEAIAALRSKINLDTDKWDDILDAQHDALFVVAGAKGTLLNDLRGAVDRAISEGLRPEEFQKQFERIAEGWDHTGDKAWRSRIIYQTNLSQAYGAGRATYQLDPEVLRVQPFLQWVHGDSARPRPKHLALDGRVFRAQEIPFWPPNGYGCQCRTVSLSQRQVDRQGLTISDLKRGDQVSVEIDGRTYNPVLEPDKGFDRIPGRGDRRRILEGVIGRLAPEIARQVREEWAQIDAQMAAAQVGEPKPAGTPVSQALRLPKSEQARELQETLDLIDGIHGDGKLDRLPFSWSKSRTTNGSYVFNRAGEATGMLISRDASTKGLTLAHEIGHWLDHQALGAKGKWASANLSKAGAEMQAWARAVDGSKSLQTLKDGLQKGYFEITDATGVVQIPADKRYLRYLLDPPEVWARSYAQYIAEKSANPLLLQQLDGIRGGHPAYRFRQWESEDFAPIAAAIDKLLEAKGWRL